MNNKLQNAYKNWKKVNEQKRKQGSWFIRLSISLNNRDKFIQLLSKESMNDEEKIFFNDYITDLVSSESSFGGISHYALPSRDKKENLKSVLTKVLKDIVKNQDFIGNKVEQVASTLRSGFSNSSNDILNITNDFPALRNRIISFLFPINFTTIVAEAYFNKVWDRCKKNYEIECNGDNNYFKKNLCLMGALVDEGTSNEELTLIKIFFWELTEMNFDAYELLEQTKQIILYGAPGTGKTYLAMNLAKDFILSNNNNSEASSTKDNEEEFENKYRFTKNLKNTNSHNKERQECEHGLYEIIQFHPNYTYQDFIGGIAPNINGNAIAYELKEGIFQKFCKAAQLSPSCNFVLIIDEINRANLSEVFGELLYALEYRDRAVDIPYFGEFIIPSNVYIIGTMNDVDKSLVTFDLALRRRFGFFKLDPELYVLHDIDVSNIANYISKCENLNKSIVDQGSLGLDKSYQIGQAYFLKIKNFMNDEEKILPIHLEKLWMYHIEPLLKEYLGMSLESGEIKIKLEEIKKEFIKENK